MTEHPLTTDDVPNERDITDAMMLEGLDPDDTNMRREIVRLFVEGVRAAKERHHDSGDDPVAEDESRGLEVYGAPHLHDTLSEFVGDTKLDDTLVSSARHLHEYTARRRAKASTEHLSVVYVEEIADAYEDDPRPEGNEARAFTPNQGEA